MIRLRRASAITVLSLFACAASASAECAWVLWDGTVGINQWTIFGAPRRLRSSFIVAELAAWVEHAYWMRWSARTRMD
jgi:hypothetical protein